MLSSEPDRVTYVAIGKGGPVALAFYHHLTLGQVQMFMDGQITATSKGMIPRKKCEPTTTFFILQKVTKEYSGGRRLRA